MAMGEVGGGGGGRRRNRDADFSIPFSNNRGEV
jgi:hypothetical protein